MELQNAKEFIFNDMDAHKIYISKDLQKLRDMNNGFLEFITAVVETESGDTLMELDTNYNGEVYIWRRVIHKDYYMKHYCNWEVVKV